MVAHLRAFEKLQVPSFKGQSRTKSHYKVKGGLEFWMWHRLMRMRQPIKSARFLVGVSRIWMGPKQLWVKVVKRKYGECDRRHVPQKKYGVNMWMICCYCYERSSSEEVILFCTYIDQYYQICGMLWIVI